MAIGAITVDKQAAAEGPVRMDLIHFLGDDSYAAGGTATFEASVQVALDMSVDILYVVAEDCGGYVPVYDRSADKLKVYHCDYDAVADGPLVENTTSDLSGTTFNLWVVSQ